MSTEQTNAAALSALVRFGVSDELLAMLDGLRETPGIAGRKFRPEAVNALCQSVLCRNYGKSCLELSYLLWAVVNGPGGGANDGMEVSPLLRFFWVDECITPRRFRHHFSQATDTSKMVLGEQGLVLQPGGEFTISATRVGYLAALLELLVNIDPGWITRVEEELAGAGDTGIKAVASALQKSLYEFLNQHLQPAQQQRRFRAILGWLEEQHRPGASLASQLNDQQLLAFWQAKATDPDNSLGFKRYRTVAENFCHFFQALQAGQLLQNIDHAGTIGLSVEQGEIHPEHLDQLMDSLYRDDIDVAALAGDPKFISKQQQQWLQPLLDNVSVLRVLPLSLVRMQLFGDWQAEIVQATRARAPEVLANKLAKTDHLDYRDYLAQLAQLQHALQQVTLAVLDILMAHREPAAVTQLMAGLAGDERRQLYLALKAGGALLVGDDEEQRLASLARHFFDELPALRLGNPGLNARCKAAAAAFKANNRQGFKKRPEVDNLSPYLAGADDIELIVRHLTLLGKMVQKSCADSGIERQFSADLSIFRDTFSLIHEVNHGE